MQTLTIYGIATVMSYPVTEENFPDGLDAALEFYETRGYRTEVTES